MHPQNKSSFTAKEKPCSGGAFRLVVLSAALVLICGWNAASIAAPGKQRAARSYFNDRYGFSIEVPSEFGELKESENGDGFRAQSNDKAADLRAWATWSNWQGDEMSLKQERDWDVKNLAGDDLPNPTITYQAQGKNWYVISGTSGDKTFYFKTLKTKDSFDTVRLLYPTVQQTKWKPVLERLLRTFRG